jgi:hypothetical protein
MDILNLVGSVVMSGFIALTVLAMYLFVKRSVCLDPQSGINHAISSRFDSDEELESYHVQHARNVEDLAERRLRAYRALFARVRSRLDPGKARAYPDPGARYNELKR